MNKIMTRHLGILLMLLFGLLWMPAAQGAPNHEPVGSLAPSLSSVPEAQAASGDPLPSLLTRFRGRMGVLFKKMGIDAEFVRLYARWVVGAPVLVVSILIAMLLRPRGTIAVTTQPERSTTPAATSLPHKKRPANRPKLKPYKNAVKLSDQQQVLRFFLELFKRQNEADPDVPAQIVRTETRPTCPNETYEMRILIDEEWMTRRMSIGLLGQGGGSRSKCFYVIYDTHMVIKIPATPMLRFSDYKRQIETEGRIVSRLAPRQCIVPRVSVILKLVHSFSDEAPAGEEALEAKYFELVENNADLQEHLKIDDSFALFMDLAKHHFLSTTLEEIHSGYGRLIDEARQHPELLWDHHAFVCRYGEESGTMCHALQEVYRRCEDNLRQLVERADVAVSTYHLRQWFLCHVAGEIIQREDHDLPQEVTDQANKLLSQVMRDNRGVVNQYRRRIKEYIRGTRFTQYLRPVESLCTNILDLLAWIGEKGLALRDLKPENLFVAGNPEDYPGFLNDAEKFSIGLIDVETAVAVDAEDPVLIPQPQLAGTPLYATPAHLMPNAVLMEVYEDLRTLLHLQDWYAAIAILYRIVTGDNLFGTTAHVFPEILNRLKLLDPAGPDMEKEVAAIQRLFWNSAVAEFQEAMTKSAPDLASVEVRVPLAFVPELKAGLHAEVREIERTVERAVLEQSFFNSGDKRRFLKQATSEKINKMKNKLAQEAESGLGQSSQVLLYFELLEKLKNRLEHKQQAEATLNAPQPAITVDHLMEMMFQRVFTTMHPERWPELAPKLYGSSAFLATDITTYQATL